MFEYNFHAYCLAALSSPSPGISHRTHGINIVFNLRWSNHDDLVNALELVSCDVEPWSKLEELYPSCKGSIEEHERLMREEEREQDNVQEGKRNFAVAVLGRVSWENDLGTRGEEVLLRQVRWSEEDGEVSLRLERTDKDLGLEAGARFALERMRNRINHVSAAFLGLNPGR